MKTKILILVLLVGLLVIVATIGKTYMPEWVLTLSVLAALMCVTYFTLLLYSKGKSYFEGKFNTLHSNIEESKNELTTELVNLIIDKHNSLLQLVSNSVDSLNKESARRTVSMVEQFAAQTAEIEKNFKNEAEFINTLSETINSLSVQMLSKISADSDKLEKLLSQTSDLLNKESENTRKLIAETTTSISSLLNTQKEEAENTIVTSTTSIVTKIQEHSDSFSSTISLLSNKLESTKEQIREMRLAVNDVDAQYTNLILKLGSTQEYLEQSSEKLNENITTSIINVKESIVSETTKNTKSISDIITSEVSKISQNIDNSSKICNDNVKTIIESIAEGNTSLSNKVDSLEKQVIALSSDLKNMDEADFKIENYLESIQEQCSSVQKGLAGVQIQSSNVEKALNSFVSQNANDKIIKSIKILIDNLQKESKSGVSDINEELLEIQIKQDSTNEQLNKLHTLLRNIPAPSSSTQSNVIEQTATTQTNTPTKPNELIVTNTPKTPISPLPIVKPVQKQPEVKKELIPILPTPIKQEPNPNRTETIVDSQTNNIVLNQFVDGKLAKSIMKDVKGHLLYELEYKNGQIAKSRNYDIKGNMNIEQIYYDNGQVHFRNEITRNGKITTEFDRNGNKK